MATDLEPRRLHRSRATTDVRRLLFHSVKVLLIHQYYAPLRGAFRVLFGVEQALQALGHEPIVYASQTREGLATRYASFFPRGFTRAELARTSPLELARHAVNGIYSFPARRGLRRLIHATSPDAAIVFRPEYQLTYSVLSELKANGIPAALWLVDFRYWCSEGFLFNPTLRETCTRCVNGAHWNAVRYRCSDGSLAKSAYDATVRLVTHTALSLHRLADRYVVPTGTTLKIATDTLALPRERIHVIPHPMSPIETSSHPAAAQGRQVVFYGRLTPEKGLGILLDAVARVPDLRLEIYGLDPLGREHVVRDDIERLGIADRVLLSTTLRFGEALIERLQSAAAIILPSVWPDTSDYTLLESMTLGKAVVVASGGGNAEIVTAAGAGLVFKSGDPASLASVLSEIVAGEHDLDAMGMRGQRYVQDEYSAERFADRVDVLLSRMADDRVRG